MGALESEARSAGTSCVRRTMVPGRGLPLLWLFGDQESTTLSHEGTPLAVTRAAKGKPWLVLRG